MTRYFSRKQIDMAARLAAGKPLRSWDVHHSTLAASLRRGVVTCDADCSVRLNLFGHCLAAEANRVRLVPAFKKD